MPLLDALNPNTNIYGNKTLSDNLTNLLSGNTVSTEISPTLTGQFGALNLSGNLAIGDTKKAMIYSPIYNVGSPNSTVSNSPSTSQSGTGGGMFDFLAQPTNLLVIGGVGIAAVLLLGGKKK